MFFWAPILSFGAKSDGQSFVDYLKAVDGIKAKKYGGEGYKLNGKDENTLVYAFNKAVKKNVNPNVVFCEVPVCNASGKQKNRRAYKQLLYRRL